MTDHFDGMEPAGPVAQRTIAEARQTALEALKNVERGERNSLDRLRDGICTYLTALIADGVPKEEALTKIRELIATPASADPTWLHPSAREALMDLATHWCSQQYMQALNDADSLEN